MEPKQENVGRFARSVESGWIGKIVAIETVNGEEFYRMQGVDNLCHTVLGGSLEASLTPDDIQWFAPDDVELINK